MPSNWKQKEIAGRDWFGNFFKRHPYISMRKPESTSIARAKCLNRPVMNTSYDQLEVLYEKHNFTPDQIFNIDETANPTVLDKEKVLAEKGTHQVMSLPSRNLIQFEINCFFIIFRYMA